MADLSIIKNTLKEKRIKIKDFCKELNITEQGFAKIMRTNSTKIDTLELIASKLGIPVSAFFSDATKAEVSNYMDVPIVPACAYAGYLRGYGDPEFMDTLPTMPVLIDKNYKENIRLGDIAAATHTNAYYLSHLFKAEIGLSPMKYVILRRIGEAQNLLINTDMTITQIAAQVGYNNSNYFQNVFKGALGMTPGEYRRKWTV